MHRQLPSFCMRQALSTTLSQSSRRGVHRPFQAIKYPGLQHSLRRPGTLRYNRLGASIQGRWQSSDARPLHKSLTDRNEPARSEQDQRDADTIAARKALSPAYQLWITCKKCLERSSHTISKQAYHFGSCVIQCPKCKSQHLISDNLKIRQIFSDTNVTMEEIAKQHGEKLRKGRLGADGDIEFYDDEAEAKVS